MSTPLHSSPDSPPLHHSSPIPHHHAQSPPLQLPLHTNVIQGSQREPPHFSSLISKTLTLDKHHSVLVEEVLAEGGFGVIFLVKGNDKSKYALKRVVVNSRTDYEGVLGEVAVMSLISPKTPRLLESLTHVITHYAPSTYEIQNLMPLCRTTLLQMATQRVQKSLNFETNEILEIVNDVGTGLQYLHTSSPPIIHRDIKIENVLVYEDKYVLSDFGSATCKQWDPQADSITTIQEDLDKNTTLQYRSPEMVDLYGGRGPISVASDVWALGVCGFKLMSFKDPFESILAIQNRNLNWSTTKSRYPDNLVLLIECLLAEHQSVRPSVEELIRITGSALSSSDWAPLQSAFNRITDDKKSREEASVKKQIQAQASAIVVMETTVTPRQRPKRTAVNNATTAAAAVVNSGGTNNAIIPPVLAAPPRSPCNVVGGAAAAATVDGGAKFFTSPPTTNPQPGNAISPTPPQTQTPSPQPAQQQPPPPPPPQQTSWTPPSGGSYNPFDDDYRPPATIADQPPVPQDPDTEYDVFANAPFDYFKYQPIMMSAGHYEDTATRNASNYASNNPFLYDHDFVVTTHSYEHEGVTDVTNNNAFVGVCNLSFDELQIHGASSDHHHAANSNSDS